MKLVEINLRPTDRQLRQFAVICLFALPLVGWLWGASWTVIGILAGAGLLTAAIGLALPRVLWPVFVVLSIVTAPIGMVVGELAMLICYYGLFLPIALFFRLIRRDGLQLKIDREAESYWQPKKKPAGAASYYRQS